MIYKGVDNPRCVFCVNSKKCDEDEMVFCAKKNKNVKEDFVCRKYEYDIFKREIKRKKKPDFSRFSEEEFRL